MSQSNIPKDRRLAHYLYRLRQDAFKAWRSAFNVPVRSTSPDSLSDVNLWIDWTTGQLKFRSPDGTVQTLGASGHGGTGTLGGPTVQTQTAELVPDAVATYPERPDAHLAYGAGASSIIRFTVPSLPDPASEILDVELSLHNLTVPFRKYSGDARVFVASAFYDGALPPDPPDAWPESAGTLPASGYGTFNLPRTVGEGLRDGTVNAICLLYDPENPDMWGQVAGIDDNGYPPSLSFTYLESL